MASKRKSYREMLKEIDELDDIVSLQYYTYDNSFSFSMQTAYMRGVILIAIKRRIKYLRGKQTGKKPKKVKR